ncbi:hypothetical protein GCM10022297_05040 [Lactobacillus hamsteri]|uniref:Peptidase s24-like protein n=1 Tax=Lactobacillus hamsteri DSM 5661 = JCM 6256 TaxID=1423754 RepID=A0A0R1YG44_9LACO|nr:XRE family transcriptional regulator [Lactobacillus hamsteri]KRM41226.1 peptidase s24-like protein [Lactobacillus hamsteri DSM 5661 = JCM 6256]
MTLGQKLKDLRKSKYLTLEQLAENLNELDENASFSKGRLSRWENDADEPRISSLKTVAQYYCKSLDYFFEDIITIDKVSANVYKVPVIGEITCGEAITAEQNIEDYTNVSFDTKPTNTVFALHCKGHSMEPTIPDNSLVIIEETTVEDGEIGAVLVDGNTRATLKRIKHVGNSIILNPDNRNYEPIILDSKHQGRIIGKAIKYIVPL